MSAGLARRATRCLALVLGGVPKLVGFAIVGLARAESRAWNKMIICRAAMPIIGEKIAPLSIVQIQVDGALREIQACDGGNPTVENRAGRLVRCRIKGVRIGDDLNAIARRVDDPEIISVVRNATVGVGVGLRLKDVFDKHVVEQTSCGITRFVEHGAGAAGTRWSRAVAPSREVVVGHHNIAITDPDRNIGWQLAGRIRIRLRHTLKAPGYCRRHQHVREAIYRQRGVGR